MKEHTLGIFCCWLLTVTMAACGSTQPQVPVENGTDVAPAPPTEAPAAPGDVEEPSSAALDSHTCTLDNGAVGDAKRQFTITMKAPSKFTKQGDEDDTCVIGYGPSVEESAEGVSVSVFVVHVNDAGAEQLLNEEPDGARQWAHKKSRGKAKNVGEGQLKIADQTVPYYQLDHFRFAPGHQTIISRARVHDHNVVFMAFYPPASKDAVLPTLLDIASRIVITPAQ